MKYPRGNATGLPHTRGGSHRADTQHNGAENHRRDHHLNEIDEHGAQHLQFLGHIGSNQTKDNAGDHCNNDADIKPVGVIPSWFFGFRNARSSRSFSHD